MATSESQLCAFIRSDFGAEGSVSCARTPSARGRDGTGRAGPVGSNRRPWDRRTTYSATCAGAALDPMSIRFIRMRVHVAGARAAIQPLAQGMNWTTSTLFSARLKPLTSPTARDSGADHNELISTYRWSKPLFGTDAGYP